MALGLVRFMAQGWIEEVFVQPTFFFKYVGFEWTVVWGRTGLYLHFIATALAACALAVGFHTRKAAFLFFVGFTYIQLLDVTTYLNHYYLVVLLAGLAVVLPLGRVFSVDARRRPRSSSVPALAIWVLRFQIAVVYVFAAIAKLEPDWIVHAQPLGIWLNARSDAPLVGGLMARPELAYLMSWAGFAYDLTIAGFLLYPRTRKLAYSVVVFFHAVTFLLFDIGMFPFIMVVSSTIFFAPDWPRRFIARWSKIRPQLDPPTVPKRASWLLAAAAVYITIQVALPLRHFAHPGSVLWNEVGMRFAWKVLVREKSGSITYHLRSRSTGREFQVNPLDYISWRQYSDMSGQPDLIAQLGRHIGHTLAKDHGALEVRVESWVSLNGRAPALLLDDQVDLMTLSDRHVPDHVLPEPSGRPLRNYSTKLTRLLP